MLHPGSLASDGVPGAEIESGASPAIDRLAEAGAGGRAFLRSAWFEAAAGDRPLTTLVGRGTAGTPIAAMPLVARRVGPLALREIAGSYWPYRSFPLAADADPADLAAMLASPAARSALGKAWRIGPTHADDPALAVIAAIAAEAGWIELRRSLGTCFVVDVDGLRNAGTWPSSKTLRKNRWLERRLAEAGTLDFRTVSGAGWTRESFALFARIESESWVAREADRRDTKFVGDASRRLWEAAVGDGALRDMLTGSLLMVGDEPAAFTFALRCGDTLHLIANSYSERFREGSPGRILLYRDFQAAADSGVRTIDWGAGDPGYKTEMGARPGPEIVDCLFVRGRAAAAVARPRWGRGYIG